MGWEWDGTGWNAVIPRRYGPTAALGRDPGVSLRTGNGPEERGHRFCVLELRGSNSSRLNPSSLSTRMRTLTKYFQEELTEFHPTTPSVLLYIILFPGRPANNARILKNISYSRRYNPLKGGGDGREKKKTTTLKIQ
ncbi:hypothetical protein DV515_00004746, partial [Chloebia gouldiae]